jgi:hypothetical protein
MRLLRRVLLFALVLAAAEGCARRTYPVTGRVVFKDGSPVPGGIVVFSPLDPQSHTGARGYIQPDGTFEISTFQTGDGSFEGRFQVLVKGPSPGGGEDGPRRVVPQVDPRYARFETSGIEIEVKAGKNDLLIEVDRLPTGSRKP